MYGKEKMISWM